MVRAMRHVNSTDVATPRRAESVPLYRTVPGLVRDPLKAFEDIGRRSHGEIVRLDLGLFRPYLVTSPDHVQHILRDRADNYLREGMLWKPMRRFLGDGLFSDGPTWAASRKFIQPIFSARNVLSLIERMAEAVAKAVEAMNGRAQSGQKLDASVEMARIVYRALIRVFFGDRIAPADAERLIAALDTIGTSVTYRLLLPFVPESVPMPGDRAFRRATRTVNSIMFPLVRESRNRGGQGNDIVTMLCHARDEDGGGLADREVRDYVVSLFAAGTETTTMALTWVWVALHANPGVSAKLHEEIERVVGQDRVHGSQLADLRYTKMVVQETLRLYPVGWILPRRAAKGDVVGGVRIKAGDTILLSPYLTHRMEPFWDGPHVFDPERFSPDNADSRLRYAYFPFSGGIHQCLGSHFFTVEAQLILANVLSRYEPTLCNSAPVTKRAGITLRPRTPVEMVLRPLAA